MGIKNIYKRFNLNTCKKIHIFDKSRIGLDISFICAKAVLENISVNETFNILKNEVYEGNKLFLFLETSIVKTNYKDEEIEKRKNNVMKNVKITDYMKKSKSLKFYNELKNIISSITNNKRYINYTLFVKVYNFLVNFILDSFNFNCRYNKYNRKLKNINLELNVNPYDINFIYTDDNNKNSYDVKLLFLSFIRNCGNLNNLVIDELICNDNIDNEIKFEFSDYFYISKCCFKEYLFELLYLIKNDSNYVELYEDKRLDELIYNNLYKDVFIIHCKYESDVLISNLYKDKIITYVYSGDSDFILMGIDFINQSLYNEKIICNCIIEDYNYPLLSICLGNDYMEGININVNDEDLLNKNLDIKKYISSKIDNLDKLDKIMNIYNYYKYLDYRYLLK